jgi:hypothetical protein
MLKELKKDYLQGLVDDLIGKLQESVTPLHEIDDELAAAGRACVR